MKTFLLVLLIAPFASLSQIDSKLLIGSWCVEKITNVPAPGGKEIIQTEMMDEFLGVVMIFTNDEYILYSDFSYEDLHADYTFSNKDNTITIIYTDTEEVNIYKAEKITKDELVFVFEDAYGKYRFFMKRCE
jgi:hypothetical protein